MASFTGCHESLKPFVLETGGGCVDVTPRKVHLDSVLVPLQRAVFLSLAGPKLSIQQLTGHAMVVQPDARPTHRS